MREQDAPNRMRSAIGDLRESASRNRAVPGLVQSTRPSPRSGQEGHPATRDFMRERFARLRADLAELIAADQAAGRIRADLDPVDLASLSIAASDGLQVQWLLDPEAVDGSGCCGCSNASCPREAPTAPTAPPPDGDDGGADRGPDEGPDRTTCLPARTAERPAPRGPAAPTAPRTTR